MGKIKFYSVIIFSLLSVMAKAQDSISFIEPSSDDKKLKLSGELLVDERFLLKDKTPWAWNEDRLSLSLDKKILNSSKFHAEAWVRYIGLPSFVSTYDLYNAGIINPVNLSLREAYFEVTGFLSKKIDLKIGRQRIVWGTADKLNPTDNLNPYDLEDIFDFGRHRGSDAININYYFYKDFSLQGIYMPFFQPANLPVGMFSGILSGGMELPQGLTLLQFSDTLLTPKYNLGESSSAGLKLKGNLSVLDFSVSYLWGHIGLPVITRNTITAVDTLGGINVRTQLSYPRVHIFGADIATSVVGIGLWAEAALFLPEKDVIMTTDLSALYPLSPVPVTQDSMLLDKTKPYCKFIVGLDYMFREGSYLNFQYLHGFMHEMGGKNLNDYFFLGYEKKFFRDKLKIAPVGGAFIINDWKDIKHNYAFAYMPQISYKPVDDAEIIIAASLCGGEGKNMFANLKDFNMFMFKVKYSF
ncbi:MAG: hypothetical protein M0R16_07375 [Bacteroidales bacterium]|jgi:hypothetical protein|nr:hypothetical protein [Bacteroidales bacterium]